MNVGVACTDHYSIITVEQQVAIETVGPCLHGKEKAEKHRAVGNCCRRYGPSLGLVFDVTMHPIDESSEERAHEEREQGPIFYSDIGGQRKEIESNVFVVKRFVRAIRHATEKLQKNAPVADLSRGDKQSDESDAASDSEAPWQPIAHEFQQIGLRRNGRELPVEPSVIGSRPLGKVKREPDVRPHDDGGCHEDDEKKCGLGADRRPKD